MKPDSNQPPMPTASLPASVHPARVYLDHNATAPLRASVKGLLEGVAAAGNPSSRHREGQRARAIIDGARLDLARLLGVRRDSLVFTSGGTEANALALMAARGGGASWHLFLASEHPCVLSAASVLGLPSRQIALQADGTIDMADLRCGLAVMTASKPEASAQGGVVSVQLVSHESGVIQPVAAVAAALPEHTWLHVDAVQAAARLDIAALMAAVDENPSGISSKRVILSLSGHKIGALSGVGAAVIPSALSPAPLWAGGNQEFRFRPGTENLLGIASLGMAARELRSSWREENKHIAQLRGIMERELSKCGAPAPIPAPIPPPIIVAANSPRVGNTSLLIASCGTADELVMALDLRGFAVSAGAACSSGEVTPIASLVAMGYTQQQARRAVRVSLGYGNTEDEVLRFVAAWREVTLLLR